MTEAGNATFSFARIFAIACTVATLPIAPFLFITLETVRLHPFPLTSGERRSNGSILLHLTGKPDIRVIAVRLDRGAWLAAGSPAIGRQLRNLPPGTFIEYVVESGRERRTINGTVVNAPADVGTMAARAVRGLLALFFLVSGATLAVGGQNRPALHAAGFVAGAGAAIGTVFLEPAVVRIGSQAVRNGVIVASVAVPSTLWCYYLLAFIAVFPTTLELGRLTRLTMATIASLATVRSALLAIAQISVLFDAMPWRAQFTVIRLLEGATLQNACYLLCSIAGIWLLVRQIGTLRVGTVRVDHRLARRARIVGGTVVVGFGPVLTAVFIQASSLILRRRLFFSSLEMSLLLLPLALVPLAIAYALLARRVHTVSIAARRAALFAAAEGTIACAAVLPLLGIGWIVYLRRTESLERIFITYPVALTLSFLLAIGALRYAGAAHDLLERLFFRGRRDAREILRSLADKSRRATNVVELSHLLIAEIDGAFHLESIALFVRDPSSEAFATVSASLPPIDASSRIATLLNQTHEIIDVDQGASRRALRNLSEIERHWLDEGQVRLIVPMIASDGSLLAFLAIGEKMDELPFTNEDRALLAAVAASAALVLENHLLRIAPPSAPAATSSEPDSQAQIAYRCPICRRLYSPLLRTRCPDDDTQLVQAEVPHLLSGKYRFEAEIGAGGMGVVYRARDLSLGRNVAVKTLPRVSTETLARLRREARATATLSHPNLAMIFAAEAWHGVPMLVFELLDGGTLRDRIAAAPLPVAAVIDVGVQLCEALESAHRVGILHRDIKPSNVGFSSSGVPKLLDFGLAKFFEISIGDRRPTSDSVGDSIDDKPFDTGSSGLVGTPAYLSPEAILGEAIHPDFDVWGLALTLYEAITGTNPFLNPSPTKTMNAILHQSVPDPRSKRRDCPSRLAELLQASLARNRQSRPHSAAELGTLLDAVR